MIAKVLNRLQRQAYFIKLLFFFFFVRNMSEDWFFRILSFSIGKSGLPADDAYSKCVEISC